MRFAKKTPCGNFAVMIQSVIEDDDELIPGESIYALVQLLEETAQTFRLACDPDLQRGVTSGSLDE